MGGLDEIDDYWLDRTDAHFTESKRRIGLRYCPSMQDGYRTILQNNTKNEDPRSQGMPAEAPKGSFSPMPGPLQRGPVATPPH
jgi:hypothetical protein